MNPLKWKKEHMAALVLTTIIAGGIGLAHGVHQHPTIYYDPALATESYAAAAMRVWLKRLESAGIGAALGGAVIYIWRLMRA